MADEPSAWDKFTGVVKSALQGPIGQNIVGGALGAMTQGDPYTIDRFWTGIEQQKQRKALKQLAVNLKVIKPEEELPAWVQSAQDLQPQYSAPTKQGIYEYPAGGGVPVLLPGTAPPAIPNKPVVRMTEQGLVQVTPGEQPVTSFVTGPHGEKLTPSYADPFARAQAAAKGRIAGEEEAGKGGPPTIVDKANEVWMYPDGRVMSDVDGPISTKEAKALGGRPITTRTAENVSAGQQALVMLKNLADVVDRLQAQGKLLDAQGLEALWDRATKQWKGYSGDPDLAELQGYGSDLIIIARQLGEKGVRAIQAYEGMLGLFGTGRAPYSAIRNYLKTNLDQALRAGVPKQVPGAYDPTKFPGATLMGAAGEAVPAHQGPITGKTSSGMGYTVEDVP